MFVSALYDAQGCKTFVNDFRGNRNLGGLDRAEGVLCDRFVVVVTGAKVTELLVFLVDFAAGADVNEKGDENNNPRRPKRLVFGSSGRDLG